MTPCTPPSCWVLYTSSNTALKLLTWSLTCAAEEGVAEAGQDRDPGRAEVAGLVLPDLAAVAARPASRRRGAREAGGECVTFYTA
jgi:hypothetical protein